MPRTSLEQTAILALEPLGVVRVGAVVRMRVRDGSIVDHLRAH